MDLTRRGLEMGGLLVLVLLRSCLLSAVDGYNNNNTIVATKVSKLCTSVRDTAEAQRQCWGSELVIFTMSISPEQEALIGRVFEIYLKEHHHEDILQLVADSVEENHHPVVVNAMTLFEANMEVGDYFNAYSNDVLAIFDKVLHRTAMELLKNASPKHNSGQGSKEHRMRYTLHARITGLPVCPELTRDTIPRSRDVRHFLSVTGTVIRTSVTKVLEYERDYMCTKCRHVFMVQADFEQFYTFAQPVTCPNPTGCNSYKFSCLSGGSEPAACRDYQEIKIQEQVQRLSVGCIPRSMVVVLEDDLVDSCKSGDDVTVYGVMCQRWKPFYDGACCEVELVLKANNIEVNNQQAVAAMAMRDVQKEFEDFWNNYKHNPIAGECHMLLVGDPGTGKSQFLKYAAKIIPRSVLTAGIGSTSAGLTVAAVKDGGDWHLEAGALVLSDGGLCCIDEFNSIKEHDRISIHEAMEQQSISVAKAGMVCKLNTRTTILAAANPKGPYDPNEPLSVNVALASPLLSRFDLVLVLMDTKNAEWDRIISSFILEDRGLPADASGLWSLEKMKAYFSVIKCLKPQVSEEANSILTRYYQLQRQSDSCNTGRTTIRMLESLSRLAEAHARLMYRATVTTEDAVMAVSVMECSMQGGALLGNVNALLTSFPADPVKEYQTQCQILLEGLNLPLLLQKEMDRLNRLKSRTSEDSLTTDYQHQLRDANSIHRTHYEIRNCKDDGLNWFHSITTSTQVSMAGPTITVTQENRKTNLSWSEISSVTTQSSCQTEDILNSEKQKNERNNNKQENSFITQEEMEQSERQKGRKHPESSRCVFQKVSKNLRDRRLRELIHQQCEKENGGLHGERVVSRDSVSKHVTDILETTSESHTASTASPGKNWHTNNIVQDNLFSVKGKEKKDERDQTEAEKKKNIVAVLREKVAAEAETSKELHAKLSGFVFKPRKMKPSVHDQDLNVCSDVRAEIQTGCNPLSRDFHTNTESRTSKEKKIIQDDSDSPLTKKRQNENQFLSEGGKRRKQLSCFSEMRDSRSEDGICFPSKGLDKDDFSFETDKSAQGKPVNGIKDRGQTENQQEQRIRVNTGDETKVPPLKPGTYISDPALAKSSHTKSTVAPSTLAILSRFSFTSTTEPKTTAQSKVGKDPPSGVEKSSTKRHCAEYSSGNSPLRKKTKTIVVMDEVKDMLPSSATEFIPGQRHKQWRETPTKIMCRENQMEPNHSKSFKTVNDRPVDYQNTKSEEEKVF
ncbi:DNA helicase MCM9 [Collichthys lucidus]|uniref:DNA helicase MCM9 n=1 Tax=Collichthys lucidus TaxID=240159 RepID=A0A4U5UH21_COLLU|nr:DNA helicase MCM9 [Collichthys lucidus]